jgi:hypothetical protein
MLRDIDIAASHGIAMDIVQLLPHHRLVFDKLRRVAFLPCLISVVAS